MHCMCMCIGRRVRAGGEHVCYLRSRVRIEECASTKLSPKRFDTHLRLLAG